MKKVAQNLLWVMISFIMVLIHLSIFTQSKIYDNFWPYVIGIVITIIVAALTFNKLEKLMDSLTIPVYTNYLKEILKKWWFWLITVFVIIFLSNLLFSLPQLFMTEENVYSKITVAGSKYYGVILNLGFSGLLLFTSIITMYSTIHKKLWLKF